MDITAAGVFLILLPSPNNFWTGRMYKLRYLQGERNLREQGWHSRTNAELLFNRTDRTAWKYWQV